MDLIDPLIDGVVRGDEAIVNHIVMLGASLIMNDEQGLTCLHWAASTTEGEKLVPFLIAKGADINAVDPLGRTPLHIHSARGRIYAVACLVHHGAHLNLRTMDGNNLTPLDMALRHNQLEVVRILIAYGAESSPLSEPIGTGSVNRDKASLATTPTDKY